MRMWRTIGVIVGLSLLVAACSGVSDQGSGGNVGQFVPVDGGGSYTDITEQDLQAMLVAKDFFFVNVHIPYEGEIPDTDAFILFDEIGSRLGDFPSEKAAKVVLYCRSGSMSSIAARELVGNGFTNVYNLGGGFRAWEGAGNDFVQ